MLTEYATELAQSDHLFAAFKRLRESPDFASLNPGQQKVIYNALRYFRLGGIDLDDSKRQRFRELNAELAQLTTSFSENVLDATQAWNKNIYDEAPLAGVPESTLELTRQIAKQRDQSEIR